MRPRPRPGGRRASGPAPLHATCGGRRFASRLSGPSGSASRPDAAYDGGMLGLPGTGVLLATAVVVAAAPATAVLGDISATSAMPSTRVSSLTPCRRRAWSIAPAMAPRGRSGSARACCHTTASRSSGIPSRPRRAGTRDQSASTTWRPRRSPASRAPIGASSGRFCAMRRAGG